MRRSALAAAALLALTAGPALGAETDRASDAPEARVVDPRAVDDAPSYDEAMRRWRGVEDVNAWIGARFEYDVARAIRLSETGRQAGGALPIHRPEAFFAAPRGICVDLARFAVETLRAIAPETKPAYVMIEFAPVAVSGAILRRHWMASFERDGMLYVFADSKRPGVLAGPYRSVREFVEEYAAYRGREVVAVRTLDSYERKARTLATKRTRQERPGETR